MQIIARIDPPTGYTRPPSEVHAEYPKWIHFADRPSVLVQTREEEDALVTRDEMPGSEPEITTPAAPVVSLQGGNDEEAMLRKIAAERNIHLDGRWGLAKIRRVVNGAIPQATE